VTSVDLRLVQQLRLNMGLRRAVETGTYRGVTTRALAAVFPSVVTIELSTRLYDAAADSLADLPNVALLRGSSTDHLREIVDPDTPTLYFLDGHWSGGVTAGSEQPCPVLEELAAIGFGHSDDCLVIDDARMFTSSPPPPHDASRWPTLVEVFDAIRAPRPEHVVTLLDDQIIAVPTRGKPVVDAYGQQLGGGFKTRLHGLVSTVRHRVGA
jgi:hypothetical protein